MSLPPQDEIKDSYSYAEVQHLVARQVMQHRLENIELTIARNNEAFNNSMKDVHDSLLQIKNAISTMQDLNTKSNKDLRNEIEKDFVTKIELAEVKTELMKEIADLRTEQKLLSNKVVIFVSIAVFVIQWVFEFI